MPVRSGLPKSSSACSRKIEVPSTQMLKMPERVLHGVTWCWCLRLWHPLRTHFVHLRRLSWPKVISESVRKHFTTRAKLANRAKGIQSQVKALLFSMSFVQLWHRDSELEGLLAFLVKAIQHCRLRASGFLLSQKIA